MRARHDIPQRIERQAAMCASMGSAFYGAFLNEMARAYRENAVVRALLDRHESRSRVGLRLAGAAHYRALCADAPAIAAHFPSTGGDGDAIAAWRALASDVAENDAIYDGLMERPVQTNEVARALPVLAGMLTISHETRMPLRIFEVGSSAGLLLNFDRYRYTGASWAWGDPDARLKIENATREGAPQHLDADLDVAERRGCDLHPLNAADTFDANTLLGFVWPDQRERFDRLRAALEVAREHPPRIERGDAPEWIERVAQPVAGAVTVVLHTVMTEHLTAAQRDALRSSIAAIAERASVEAPFAWARMEPGEGGGYETSVTIWPAREEIFLARSDGHAQQIEWSVRVS